MYAIRLLALLLFGLVWNPFLALSQEKPLTPEEEKDQKSLFQWLDKHYELPDLSKTELVSVSNHVWGPPLASMMSLPYLTEYGFLLKETPKTFTILFTTTIKLTLPQIGRAHV